MISEMTYYRRGWKYMETEEGRLKVLEYLLDSLKNENLYKASRTLIEIYSILDGKHMFFISRETPNVFKLREQKEQIQKEFIDFFFKKHIDEMIDLFKKIKKDDSGISFYFLSYYLPIMVKHILKGSPTPEHIVKIYLFLIDNFNSYKKEKDEVLRDVLRKISLRGLNRYACRKEILRNVIDEIDFKEYEELNLDAYEELFNFLKKNKNLNFIENLSLFIFIKPHITYALDKNIFYLLNKDKEQTKSYLSKILNEYNLSIDQDRFLHNIDDINESNMKMFYKELNSKEYNNLMNSKEN